VERPRLDQALRQEKVPGTAMVAGSTPAPRRCSCCTGGPARCSSSGLDSDRATW